MKRSRLQEACHPASLPPTSEKIPPKSTRCAVLRRCAAQNDLGRRVKCCETFASTEEKASLYGRLRPGSQDGPIYFPSGSCYDEASPDAKSSAAELIQYRFPVGAGPSSNK